MVTRYVCLGESKDEGRRLVCLICRPDRARAPPGAPDQTIALGRQSDVTIKFDTPKLRCQEVSFACCDDMGDILPRDESRRCLSDADRPAEVPAGFPSSPLVSAMDRITQTSCDDAGDCPYFSKGTTKSRQRSPVPFGVHNRRLPLIHSDESHGDFFCIDGLKLERIARTDLKPIDAVHVVWNGAFRPLKN